MRKEVEPPNEWIDRRAGGGRSTQPQEKSGRYPLKLELLSLRERECGLRGQPKVARSQNCVYKCCAGPGLFSDAAYTSRAWACVMYFLCEKLIDTGIYGTGGMVGW